MSPERRRGGDPRGTGAVTGIPADRDGWNVPQPEHLPRRTPWPIAAALGTVFIFWGVVTSYLVFAVGVGLLSLAVVGWIREIRREGAPHD
ncbi:MAG TPA: hypothetical protein VEZ44_05030 [bacterium]|nr:hypothetical protein [bacterium]